MPPPDEPPDELPTSGKTPAEPGITSGGGGYRGPNVVTLLAVGSLCGISVGIGVFLGVLVDHALGTSPLFALVGTLLGIAGAAVGSYQVIRPYVKG